MPPDGGGAAGTRPKWAPLASELLKPLGYRSYHSGKWHVDGKPTENGFDRSYLLLDQDRHFSPRAHWLDDQPLPPVAADAGFYGPVATVDHAVKCLQEHAEKHAAQPFFQYLAFTVPHFPVQALPEDIARYTQRYAAGWDALRAARHKRMLDAGIVHCELSPRTEGVPAWTP